MNYALGEIAVQVERVFEDYRAAWPGGLLRSREAHVYYVWERLLHDALGWTITPHNCGYCGREH